MKAINIANQFIKSELAPYFIEHELVGYDVYPSSIVAVSTSDTCSCCGRQSTEIDDEHEIEVAYVEFGIKENPSDSHYTTNGAFALDADNNFYIVDSFEAFHEGLGKPADQIDVVEHVHYVVNNNC